MSPIGFELVELQVVGPNKVSAGLKFTTGLNVISGASDTGKSYLLELTDFMMGASTPPKEIPEAAGYEAAFMTIRSKTDDRLFTLERALRGGEFRLYDGPIDRRENGRVLRERHDSNRPDNVSRFLLGLSGLDGKRVLKRKSSPESQNLSFRNISNFILINEVRVIIQGSPIWSGQVTQKVLDSSIFRLLITGLDDSAIITPPTQAETFSRNRREGQLALLVQMIAQRGQEIAALRQECQDRGVDQPHVEAELQAALTNREEQQQVLTKQESQRQGVWKDLRKVESRVRYVDQLQYRFGLLETQYISDHARLEAISEAEYAFAQLEVETCPVCGAPEERHMHEGAQSYDLEEVREASRREAAKIAKNLKDLRSTLDELLLERNSLMSRQGILKQALDDIVMDLEKELMPHVRASSANIEALLAVRNSFNKLDFLGQELIVLQSQHDSLRVTVETAPAFAPSIADTTAVKESDLLCQVIQGILEEWCFPHIDRVVFLDKAMDIMVGGRPRGTRGKGIRAVTYAAFAIGLMRYCIERKLPHPGMVMIDSPLVAYREPDPESEQIGFEVKEAFYRTLGEGLGLGQVIILENEDPPNDVHDRINYIHFTGSNDDRSGFFPSLLA